MAAAPTSQSLPAGIGWLRGGAEHAGWRTGPMGTWVYANKQLLRIAAVTLAALALVFWGQPTGKSVGLHRVGWSADTARPNLIPNG